MAAHPKNKITRVEQGKRRAGNTPKFKIDPNTVLIAKHKKGFFTKLFNFMGSGEMSASTAAKDQASAKAKSRAEKATKKAALASKAAGVNPVAHKAQPAKAPSIIKKSSRTQHKGGG